MLLENMASALNLRDAPKGAILGELLQGDLFEVPDAKAHAVWVKGTVVQGQMRGTTAHVRRRWLVQHHESPPRVSADSRAEAAQLVARRTAEFDSVRYGLGNKARSWASLKQAQRVDCSGWVYLLGKELLEALGRSTAPKILDTFSDAQVTQVAQATGTMISAHFLRDDHFQPGCLVGIDHAEYSWDRNRPLDVDHIVMVGEDAQGRFVSQSSSSGAGVNRVPLAKWLESLDHLRRAGRMHLVDLLQIP